MSGVRLKDRTKSKSQFDNTYYKLFDDVTDMVNNGFYASTELKEQYASFIKEKGEALQKIVDDIGTHIRIANSIFPMFPDERAERRKHQGIAIGLSFDLLTKYNLIMQKLEIPDDKHTEELKHVIHEINCLKRWLKSDDERFKHIG